MKKETAKNDTSLIKTTAVWVCGAIVLFAAVIAVLVLKKGTVKTTLEPLTKYTVTQEQDENTSEDETVNKYVVFTDENNESYTLFGEDYMANLSEDRFIVVNNGKLSFFAEGEEKELARNVISCSISNDGSLVAFVIPNSDEKQYIGTLYTYNTVTGSWEDICSDIFVSTTSTIQISPSGDTVAYVRNYDEDALTYDCCYYNKGEETTIGQNIDVWAISDDAEYIYYAKENTEDYSSVFCVYTEKNGEVVLDEEAYNNFYLNLDYSECVYSLAKEEEPLYISRKGSEGEVYLETAEDFDTTSLVDHVNKVISADSFK
ncbi:MAG: hypothetical protein LUH47_09260 [Clostridiales bacterium]|nr:hypothetical protein [Clostridiales bacterium]